MSNLREISDQTNNLSTICRLCLCSSETLHYLFRLDEIESVAVTLPMKITICTSINVSKNDLLPRKICTSCMNKINEWYVFKKVCLKSDATLKCLIRQREEQKADLQRDIDQMNSVIQPTENFKYFDIDFEDIHCDLDVDTFPDLPTDIQQSTVEDENCHKKLNELSETLLENHSDENLSQVKDDLTLDLLDLRENEEKLVELSKKPLLGKPKLKLKCKKCPDSFYLMSDYQNHIKLIHKDNCVKQKLKYNCSPKQNAEKTNKIIRARYEMRCNSCCKVFFSKSQFRNHYLKKHPGEKPFICEICGKKEFISEDTLKRHKMLHTGRYRCNLCGKTFTCNAILKLHVKDKHENDKPFVCDICGKCFVSELLMNYHKRFHTGEKKYICEECGLAVVTSSSLAKHKRTHREIKPHICSICNKGFITKSRLIEHFRTHTGERPYECSVCTKTFTMRDKLKRHFRIHSGEKLYSCEYCGNNYATSYGLSVHLKSQNSHN